MKKIMRPDSYLSLGGTSEDRKLLAETVINNLREVNGKFYANIPVKLLATRSYQRVTSPTVYKIRDNWNDKRCGFLTVCYNEAKHGFYVIDGEHRACAARMRGIESLPCRVYMGLTESQEALIFISQIEGRNKLSAIDTFRANQFVTPEDDSPLSEIDKAIKVTCDKYGIFVDNYSKANTLRHVPTLRTIANSNGVDCIDYILSIICMAGWNESSDGMRAEFFRAISRIYKEYGDNPTIKKKIAARLKTMKPKDAVAIARVNYTGAGNDKLIAELLRDIIKGEI